MSTDRGEVTGLLERVGSGDSSAASELFPRIYDELHRIGEACLRGERPGHTLQPTALVHEAYLRLIGPDRELEVRNRAHFVAVAAGAMRRILVNHALARKAAKRGGSAGDRVPLDEALSLFETRSVDLAALDEALGRLASFDPLQCRIVELRFFGGLDFEDVATALHMPLRTIEREWAMARAWLRRELGGE